MLLAAALLWLVADGSAIRRRRAAAHPPRRTLVLDGRPGPCVALGGLYGPGGAPGAVEYRTARTAALGAARGPLVVAWVRGGAIVGVDLLAAGEVARSPGPVTLVVGFPPRNVPASHPGRVALGPRC